MERIRAYVEQLIRLGAAFILTYFFVGAGYVLIRDFKPGIADYLKHFRF